MPSRDAGRRRAARPRALRSRLWLWLPLLLVPVITAGTVTTIARGREDADQARQAQILFAQVVAAVQEQNALEWETEAKDRVTPEIAAERRAGVRRVDALFARLAVVDADDDNVGRLAERFAVYERSAARKLHLLGAGRPDAAERLDEATVDPAFAALRRELDGVGREESEEARIALRDSMAGTSASLALAALLILGLLLNFERMRRRAEETNAERALRETRERLSAVVDEAPMVLWCTDRDGVFTVSEGAALASLGFEPAQVVGRSAFEVYADEPEVVAHLRRALAGEAFIATFQVGERVFETRYSCMLDDDGAVRTVLGVSTDVTERERDERRREELERAALTDSLTGLRNHRAFHEDLAGELRRHERSGQPLSLVMLDLDGLKRVNDSMGHGAGDDLLRRMASAMLRTLRGGDGAYRLGGDEFAIIADGAGAWGAFNLALRLRGELSAGAGSTAGVTAGIAELSGPLTRDELVNRADLALIQAKRVRRGALIYTDGLVPDSTEVDQRAERHHRSMLATALARAVDAKDSYTRSHCETVSEICALVADELGLGADRIEAVRLAGLLHDVGKIGVADAILRKPDRLTEEEFDVMKTHAQLGHGIVLGAELDQQAEWILHHHERPDGRGYPHGLEGDAVPLESRIILVADAFEAMTSDRPYRDGCSEGEALVELDAHAGTQFDPECVAALRAALARRAPRSTPTNVEALRAATAI